MNSSGQAGLASIIVPCWNQLAFTRHCIAALKRHTRAPWELIVVDNGSTDGTGTYLAGVQDAAACPVTIIADSTNRGFPAAVNQGLRRARGEYLVRLNNDVVVTDGWLDQLIALATMKAGTESEGAELAGRGIGLVGPMSNYAAPPQWVENAPYRDLDEMQEFARRWREEHRGLWFTTTKLSGFCLLMKRVVYEMIGGLDERFGLGLFDDDDLALRARQAGFELAVARDLLVHHFGSRTFAGNGVDAEALLEENARRFADKWGDDAPSGRRVAMLPFCVSDAIGERHDGEGFHDGKGSIGGPRFARPTLPADGSAGEPGDGRGSIGVPRDGRGFHDGKGSIGGPRFARPTLPADGSAGEPGDGRGSIGVPRDGRGFHDGKGSIGGPRFARPTLPADGSAGEPGDGRGSIGVPRDGRGFHDGKGSIGGPRFARPTLPADGSAGEAGDGRGSIGVPRDGQGFHDGQGLIGGPRFARPTLPADGSAGEAGDGRGSIGGPAVGHNDAPVRVSLTMIVRDEEANLPRCLGSVAGLFDEIVVVDTGSVDRTIEIAREHGARVFDFVWVDDFAAARNAALARATGDYAFWLDADDVMEPPERTKLETLLKRLKNGDEAAYVVRCACDPGENGDGGQTVVDHIRLFPVREDVRWSYRVHEQILPALRRARVPVRWSDVVVRHTGYADSATRARKLERDARILREELDERPEDPFTLFNLGSIAIERRSWGEALELLERSLAKSAPTDSITRKLYALIARARQMRGDPDGALQACAQGLAIDGEDAELWFRRAVVHRERGEPAAAEQCWRRILTLKRPERFASVDQGIYGHLTLRNLAVLARERGDAAEADRLRRAVLVECPGDREALARLERPRLAEAVP